MQASKEWIDCLSSLLDSRALGIDNKSSNLPFPYLVLSLIKQGQTREKFVSHFPRASGIAGFQTTDQISNAHTAHRYSIFLIAFALLSLLSLHHFEVQSKQSYQCTEPKINVLMLVVEHEICPYYFTTSCFSDFFPNIPH